ncbi:cwf18 pre-mRNA splicing factor domain-containing protein [Trichoderma gracile]
MNSHNSLSAAADERKARLAKLKTLKRKQPVDEVATPEGDRDASPAAAAAAAAAAEEAEKDDITARHLSGRNYDPETRGPKLGFDAPPTLGLEKPTLEEQAAEVEAEVREKAAEEARDDRGLDLFKLQPKKPNWDLKRNLDKKLEVLNVRTDNAIAKLVRERVQSAQKAAQKNETVDNGNLDGDAAGVDGIALVEGLRVREQEEQEDEERERQEEEALGL